MKDDFIVGETQNDYDNKNVNLNEEEQKYLDQHKPTFLQQKYQEELELIGDLVKYQFEYDDDGNIKKDKNGTPIFYIKNGEKQIHSSVKYDDKFELDLKRAFETYDNAQNKFNQRTAISDNNIIKDDVLMKLAVKILDDAIKENVEDVFIENYEHFGLVRFFDGSKWHNQRLIAKSVTDPLITILKFRAGLETKFENSYKKQTNGAIFHNGSNFRIATGRASFGMFMSLRLENGYFDSLDDLELPELLKRSLRERMQASSGLTVITGGTGSGKSTLATASLVERQKQAHGQLNVISLEKPVEVNINGILQIEINENKGLTWSDAIEGTLRERPDILRVGEVNGKQEAEAMVRVGNSGCTSITTIHANTALDIFRSFKSYDISETDIQNALKLSIYLARVPRLCTNCRIPVPGLTMSNYSSWVSQHLLEGAESDIPIFYKRNPKGCEKCRAKTQDETLYGTLGKIGLYEYLRINSAVLSVMRHETGKETNQLKHSLMHPDSIKWKENEINKEDEATISDNILFEPLEKDVYKQLMNGHIDIETAKIAIDR